MLHVRLDDALKDRGNAVLAAMGFSASDAVRLLYHRLIADQAFRSNSRCATPRPAQP